MRAGEWPQSLNPRCCSAWRHRWAAPGCRSAAARGVERQRQQIEGRCNNWRQGHIRQCMHLRLSLPIAPGGPSKAGGARPRPGPAALLHPQRSRQRLRSTLPAMLYHCLENAARLRPPHACPAAGSACAGAASWPGRGRRRRRRQAAVSRGAAVGALALSAASSRRPAISAGLGGGCLRAGRAALVRPQPGRLLLRAKCRLCSLGMARREQIAAADKARTAQNAGLHCRRRPPGGACVAVPHAHAALLACACHLHPSHSCVTAPWSAPAPATAAPPWAAPAPGRGAAAAAGSAGSRAWLPPRPRLAGLAPSRDPPGAGTAV